MKFTSSAIVVATLAAGQAVASTFSHNMPKHNHAARHNQQMRAHEENRAMKRSPEHIEARDISSILSLGVKAMGVNAVSNNGGVWIGSGGQYTNEFFNQGTSDLVLAVWGPWGSWVNAVTPQITVTIPANSSKVLSFADGFSGAFAPIYSDTKLVNGQISETWGECTFAGASSTCDVSREVNMKGKNMSIVTPSCITDMERCVFVCPNGQTTCMTGYELLNCGPGSQPGANYGLFEGSPSGGCGNMGGSAALKTYLNWT